MRRFSKLASGRNATWALWDRFEVPQYDGDGTYLTRWRVVSTPWGGIYLHRMSGPDPRATLHDHPWRFLSIVLRGGYVERRLNPITMKVDEHHVVRHFNRMRLCDAHAIVDLLARETWTLLFVGRRVRTWGYWEGSAWVHPDVRGDAGQWTWTEFNGHKHAAEFDAAMARRKSKTVDPGAAGRTDAQR